MIMPLSSASEKMKIDVEFINKKIFMSKEKNHKVSKN